MNAAQLLARLDSAGVAPRVEGVTLRLPAPPPAALLPSVQVLKSGLIALAAGRRWYGCDGATGRIAELDPRGPVPANVTLLAAEGAAKWDRVPSAARLDLPHLFAAPARGTGAKS